MGARRVVLIVVAVLAALAFAPPAEADTGLSFSIGPADRLSESFFTFLMTPGDARSDAALIVNNRAETVDLRVYAAGGLTSINGGSTFAGPGSEGNGTGDWIAVEFAETRLASGQSQRLPFTVTVPPGVEPGEYVAGLVIEAPGLTTAVDSGAQLAVKVVERVGVAVVVTVPGGSGAEIRVNACRMTGQDEDGASFAFDVSGMGRLLAQGDGMLALRDRGGAVLFEHGFDVATIVPQTDTTLNVFVPVHLNDGDYGLEGSIAGFALYGEERAAPSFCPGTTVEVRNGQPAAAVAEPPPDEPGEVTVLNSPSGGGIPFDRVIALGTLPFAGLGLLFLLAAWRRRRREEETATASAVQERLEQAYGEPPARVAPRAVPAANAEPRLHRAAEEGTNLTVAAAAAAGPARVAEAPIAEPQPPAVGTTTAADALAPPPPHPTPAREEAPPEESRRLAIEPLAAAPVPPAPPSTPASLPPAAPQPAAPQPAPSAPPPLGPQGQPVYYGAPGPPLPYAAPNAPLPYPAPGAPLPPAPSNGAPSYTALPNGAPPYTALPNGAPPYTALPHGAPPYGAPPYPVPPQAAPPFEQQRYVVPPAVAPQYGQQPWVAPPYPPAGTWMPPAAVPPASAPPAPGPWYAPPSAPAPPAGWYPVPPPGSWYAPLAPPTVNGDLPATAIPPASPPGPPPAADAPPTQ